MFVLTFLRATFMLLLMFEWLLERPQSKFSFSIIVFVMIEIINKEEGDACSQRIMCFLPLTDNTFGMAAIWVSTGVFESRPY